MIKLGAQSGQRVVYCDYCRQSAFAPTDRHVQIFASQHQHPEARRGLGDMVASGIKRLTGIKPCAPCARRQAQLNGVWPKR